MGWQKKRRNTVYHFCPLPPMPNGIADYAAFLSRSLAAEYNVVNFCDSPFASPENVGRVVDLCQNWRFDEPDALRIYQIGNNWDHTEILRLAIERPGLTVLHDLHLLYLHESLKLRNEELETLLWGSNPIIAPVRAKEFAEGTFKMGLDYNVFDMTDMLLSSSKAVVVHSKYAKTLIERRKGPRLAEKVHVIKHFAFPEPKIDRKAARAKLDLPAGAIVILTAGFVTASKRLDWVAQALSEVHEPTCGIIWVQAGPIRPDEFDLESIVRRHVPISFRFRSTGYIAEDELDAYVKACDILVNLRFPSVGESSGILARALPAGVCCVVSNTGAYREIPDDVVVKAPLSDPIAGLGRILQGLVDEPGIRQAFARNAREYARKKLSVRNYVEALRPIFTSYSGNHESKFAMNGASLPQSPITVPLSELVKFVFPRKGVNVVMRVGPMSEMQAAKFQSNSIANLAMDVGKVRFIRADQSSVYLELTGTSR